MKNEFMQKMQEAILGLTVSSYAFKDRFNIYKPMSDSLTIEVADKVELMGDKIVFKPLLSKLLIKINIHSKHVAILLIITTLFLKLMYLNIQYPMDMQLNHYH